MSILNEFIVDILKPIIGLVLFLVVNKYYFKKREEKVEKVREKKLAEIDRKYTHRKFATREFLEYHKEWHKFDDVIDELKNTFPTVRKQSAFLIVILFADSVLNFLDKYNVTTYTQNYQTLFTLGFVVLALAIVTYCLDAERSIKRELGKNR